jgi:HSP20 family protein
MIETAQRDELQQLAGRVNRVVNQLWQLHFGEFCPVESWSPSINIYQLEKRLEVCVDLAGLEPSAIDVRVEAGRLTIRGFRPAPEPRAAQETMRILTMEIDHGAFCRIISLSEHVDLARIKTDYTNGFLWVRLPFRKAG